jgi:CRP-like cAMP-binding protein
MSASHLVVFPSQGVSESPADRIRRLQAETRTLAREHIEMLAQALTEVSRLAGEIAGGGEAYAVGARELSRRLADEANAQALTLTAIIDRA